MILSKCYFCFGLNAVCRINIGYVVADFHKVVCYNSTLTIMTMYVCMYDKNCYVEYTIIIVFKARHSKLKFVKRLKIMMKSEMNGTNFLEINIHLFPVPLKIATNTKQNCFYYLDRTHNNRYFFQRHLSNTYIYPLCHIKFLCFLLTSLEIQGVNK